MRGGRLDVTGRIERSEASEVRSVSHCVRLTTDTHRRPNLTAQDGLWHGRDAADALGPPQLADSFGYNGGCHDNNLRPRLLY